MVWAADVQLFFMGTMAHAFKVCEEVKEKSAPASCCSSSPPPSSSSAITTIVVYIWLGYQHGMMHGSAGTTSTRLSKWGWVAKTVKTPASASAPDHPVHRHRRWARRIALLRPHRLGRRWPLHPVGLAVALTNTVRGDWFGIFLAWLVKSILISYGGVISLQEKCGRSFWGYHGGLRRRRRLVFGLFVLLLLTAHLFDSADFAGLQAHLNPVRMRRRFGQNIPHHALGQPPRALILLLHDGNAHPSLYIGPSRSVHTRSNHTGLNHARCPSCCRSRR